MKTKNPNKFWAALSKRANWKEYILPKRTEHEFEEEGKKQADELRKYYTLSQTVLDYGCGIGRVLKYIKAERKIGIDISSSFIRKAKKDISSEYFLDKEFTGSADFVYCLSVMQHNIAEERIKIIKNILKILNDGGSALINFPREDSQIYKEGRFVHKFSLDEVQSYGQYFNEYSIIEGNLANYKKSLTEYFRCQGSNEYFLIGKK